METEGYSWQPWFRLAEVARDLQDSKAFDENRKKAIESGAPADLLKHLDKGAFAPKPKPIQRLGVLVDRGQMDFIDPLIKRWQGRHEVAVGTEIADIDYLMDWADTLWFEWAGPLLIDTTKREKKNRIVVRVHGYEMHNGMMEQVDWSKVDEVIFTAQYQHYVALRRYPGLNQCRTLVIHAGIETEKMIVGAGKPGNKIAMACYGNYKKNFPLALQVFKKALEYRPELELHIAVEWQDQRTQFYVVSMIHTLELTDKVFLHPWQEDLNKFYADKSFYLSSSIEESLHVACAEAMAAGLKPVVHTWEGADSYYPLETLFDTVDNGAAMMESPPCNVLDENAFNTHLYWRKWAKDNLDISVVDRVISRFLNPPKVAVAVRDASPHRIEAKLQEAFVDNGCLMGTKDNADIVLCSDATLLDSLKDCNGRKIFWSAEQLCGDDDRAEYRREMAKKGAEWADVVLASTKQGAQELSRLVPGKPVGMLFLGGAHSGVVPLYNPKREFDVGFMGSMTPYREEMLLWLKEQGVDVAYLNSYNPEEVNRFLNQCKVSLNLHLSAEPNVETRLAESMAAGCCVISEPLPEGNPFTGKVIEVDKKALPKKLLEFSSNGKWQSKGKYSQQWVWSRLRLEQQTEALLRMIGA